MKDYIVLHHFVNPNDTPLNQQKVLIRWVKFQKESYHYAVMTNGEAVWIHNDNKLVGHCGIDFAKNHKPCNYNSIGVCLMGNFMRSEPKDKQLNGLTKLLARLMVKYNIPIERVLIHKNIPIINELTWRTQCPGDKFPIERILKMTENKLKPYHLEFKPDTNLIEIEGERYYLDYEVENINSVTFIPLRSLFEKLGYEVNWNESTKIIEMNLKGV